MRRKDCEIKDERMILGIIQKCDADRIGMVDEDGKAYIVPVNFGMDFEDGKCCLIFHSAIFGKKVRLLKENQKVSFVMDTAQKRHHSEKMPEITYHYECVMGKGHVHFIEEPTDRERALNALMSHYTNKDDWSFPDALPNRMENLSHFCTCKNFECPLHPTKHEKGCAPCIIKNLKLREIPNCFFDLTGKAAWRRGDSLKDFARLVLSEDAKQDGGIISTLAPLECALESPVRLFAGCGQTYAGSPG